MNLSAFPHLEGLVDLACRNGVDIRPTLLRVLTDLYVQKPLHSAAEERHYVELAKHLIDTVDEDTRRTVMERLAGYVSPPAALMQPRSTKPASAVAAPAPAPSDTAASLCDLFFAADSDERRLILTNLDAVSPAEAATKAEPGVIRRLEDAALAQNSAAFADVLQEATGVDRGQALRIIADISGEPIVVVARALGMPAAVMQRVLLFLNPAIGQSVQRVYNLASLYDEITPAAAATMLSIWREACAAAPAAHRPVLAESERIRPRRPHTPGPYRSVEREFAAMPSPFRAGSNRR